MATILIIDDSPFWRSHVRRVLGEDYTYLEAADGLAGLEQFMLHAPDLVWLDMTMPEMHGLDALRVIRRLDSQTPVVVATSEPELADEALALGATAFFEKPFHDERAVRQTVRLLLT
ncbi:MAG: response regulator [Chloroflexi bacterium]|nr:response regulator [Chloroflexota bacterium]